MVDKEGIMYEVRRREYFMNDAEKKREKQKHARIIKRKQFINFNAKLK